MDAEDSHKNEGDQRGFFTTFLDDAQSCIHYMTCPLCLFNPDRQKEKLHAAIENNQPDQIEHLVYRRAHDPNQIVQNDLPLVLAAKKGHVESLKKLIALKADVNLQPISQYPTALIAICAAEHLEPERVTQGVELLLKSDANPHLSCSDYYTESEIKIIEKINEAISKKNDILAEQLMRLLPPKCLGKRTALDYAQRNNYTGAANLIRTSLSSYVRKGPSKNDTKSENFQDGDIS